MATEVSESIPPEVMAELREAAAYAVKGVRDPAVMKKARQEIDRLREKTPSCIPARMSALTSSGKCVTADDRTKGRQAETEAGRVHAR